MWTSHPLCKDAVKQAWECRSTRSRAYQLRNKLSNVRKTILIWNKEFFGRVEQDINHKKKNKLKGFKIPFTTWMLKRRMSLGKT